VTCVHDAHNYSSKNPAMIVFVVIVMLPCLSVLGVLWTWSWQATLPNLHHQKSPLQRATNANASLPNPSHNHTVTPAATMP